MTILTLVALLAFSSLVAAQTDYYAVLDLPEREDATEKQIKSKFRQLSKQYHPDLHGEESREMYVKIQRAYEVLSDRRKRKIYDMKGDEGLKQLETGGNNQQQMHDPFFHLFGGGMNGGNANKGQDVQMAMLVTLEDIYNGATHTVTLSKQKLCRQCRGIGAASKDDLITCSKCNGKGVVVNKVQIMPGFFQQMQQPCPTCKGQGKTIKTKCPTCRGSKVTRGEQTLEVDIERGTPDNHKLVFEMEADQTPDQLPGDVIFYVQTANHPTYTRKGNNLEMTMKITLAQALTGFSKLIRHLDDHEVEVERVGVTQYGTKMKIAGEGMPIHNVPSERGDLTITFIFDLPESLTQEQREAIAGLYK